MLDKPKLIAIVIVAIFVVGGGAFGLSKLNIPSFNSDSNVVEMNTEEEDKQLISSVEDVSQINDQKIKSITGAEIELENGNKFTVSDPSTISCRVDDIITGYDESKQAFTCTGSNSQTNQTETRYISQPPVRNSFLTDLLLYRFFTGNTFLRNNGYTPTSSFQNNVRSTTYKGNDGTEVRTSPLSKPTVSRSSGSKSSSGSTSGTSSSSSTSGHGGGFGGSTSSSS
jgi:uncharacterized membrane protein YgcG